MSTLITPRKIVFPIADKSMKYEFSCSLKILIFIPMVDGAASLLCVFLMFCMFCEPRGNKNPLFTFVFVFHLDLKCNYREWTQKEGTGLTAALKGSRALNAAA